MKWNNFQKSLHSKFPEINQNLSATGAFLSFIYHGILWDWSFLSAYNDSIMVSTDILFTKWRSTTKHHIVKTIHQSLYKKNDLRPWTNYFHISNDTTNGSNHMASSTVTESYGKTNFTTISWKFSIDSKINRFQVSQHSDRWYHLIDFIVRVSFFFAHLPGINQFVYGENMRNIRLFGKSCPISTRWLYP